MAWHMTETHWNIAVGVEYTLAHCFLKTDPPTGKVAPRAVTKADAVRMVATFLNFILDSS
jgi:hypothetical protein